MLENYSEIIEQLIAAFIKIQATELEAEEKDIRLVLQTKEDVLFAMLYHKTKFVRKVEIKEILELLG